MYCFLSRLCPAARLSAFWLAAVLLLPAPGRGADQPASPSIDHLLSKLPDPSKLSKSPLESAVESQDPDVQRLTKMIKAGHVNLKDAHQSTLALAARYPDKPQVHFLNGAIAFGLGRYSEAEGSFERAVKLEPKFTVAWLALANCEVKQNRPAPAADAARHVTKLQPKLAAGWAAVAYCEALQNKYDAAIGDYQRAVTLQRNYAFAYRGLGICYASTNRSADAVAPLKAAVALNPKDYLAATELGYCYLRSGQYDDGTKACWQALKVRSGFSKAWDILGLCYLREGKKKEGVHALQEAAKNAPDDPAIRAHLTAATKVAAHA